REQALMELPGLRGIKARLLQLRLDTLDQVLQPLKLQSLERMLRLGQAAFRHAMRKHLRKRSLLLAGHRGKKCIQPGRIRHVASSLPDQRQEFTTGKITADLTASGVPQPAKNLFIAQGISAEPERLLI